MNIRLLVMVLLFLDLIVYLVAGASFSPLILCQDISIVLVCLFSSVLALRVSRLYLPDDATRLCWKLFGVGFLFYAIGESFYIWYEGICGITDAFPNLGDGFIITGYLLFFDSFWRALRSSKVLCFIPPKYGLRLSISIIILFYLLVFVFIFYPSLKSEEESLWIKLSPQIYPILDMIQFAFCIRLLLFFRIFGTSAIAMPWLILCSATIFTLIADLAYGYFSSFDSVQLIHWLNVLYIVSYGSMGYAFQKQKELLDNYNYLSTLD